MKAVGRRVSSAWVVVEGGEVGRIGRGLLVLVGVARGDGPAQADALAVRVDGARLFPGTGGHFHLALGDVGGGALVVSQFTLCGRTDRGRRPSLERAAPPEEAEPLYERFVERLRGQGIPVATGRFGAQMAVHLVNEGPVTCLYEVE